MATQFTYNQQRAVEETGHNILVAASAGSGKTTVLIERIIQKILSGESVENFLIVTFTNAAAKEMRERLEIAIEKRLNAVDTSTKKFLQEQLLLLPAANISTIDAYALKIIENYYHVIGLDPQFRLLSDTAERELMRQDVLETVFEDFYDESHPNHIEFLALVNNFGNPNQDDYLRQAVLKLADFSEARPDGQNWLSTLDDNELIFRNELTETNFYRQMIQPMVSELIKRLIISANVIKQTIEGVTELAKTQSAYDDILDYLNQINDIALHSTWDTLRNAIKSMPKVTLERKNSKGVKDEPELLAILEEATRVKNNIVGSESELKQLAESFFQFSQKHWQLIETKVTQQISTLIILTQSFQRAFTKLKRNEKLVDFPDLGALALEVLAHDTTRQTISSQFKEILVDEYQDINQLQETLLTKVSNGHNMYMVGDVKQSIYGFRQAEPSLFTNKYRLFNTTSNHDSRIELADNFRSQNNVTHVTNLIFTQLMDEKLGDIAYIGEAKLVPKAAYPESVSPVFELDIITKTSETLQHEEGEQETVEFEKRQAQYAHIADKIIALRETKIFDRKAEPEGMRNVQYGDIAILTRSKSGYIDLVSALRDAGIPTQVDSVGNYFQTMEVYLMLDILRIVDNPHQDIPLAAVLRSPIFGYTENELAEIRLADKKHDYWTAFTALASEDERSKHIMVLFKKWHQIAIRNDLVDLIWTIFNDTAWLDYVAGMPGGSQRQANLHAFYDYAKTYQDNTHAGLFRFIRYIEQVQENDGQLGEAPQQSDEQAVRIMTIHASKGLEFPIVILPELDKSFNTKDLSGKMLIQKNVGIGLEYLQPEAMVSMPSLKKLVVQQALKRQSWSEEMRLLYVALTRAEQQLHLIASVNVDQDDQNTRLADLWQQAKQTSGQFLPEDLRLSAKSYFEWLIISFARAKNQVLEGWLGDGSLPRLLGSETNLDYNMSVTLIPEQQIGQTKKTSLTSKISDHQPVRYGAEDIKLAKKIMNYSYPNMQSTKTVAYQSVSEMKRLFEDPDQQKLKALKILENGQFTSANELVKAKLELPDFMTDGSQKPSSSAIGTATHLILQLIDFSIVQTRQSLTALIDQLIASKRINDKVGSLINVDQILSFLETPLARNMMKYAEALTKEATFAMIMPANKIFDNLEDSKSILVHGIIDGYFINTDTKTITVFDYKTDYVNHNQMVEGLSKLKKSYEGQLKLYVTALKQEFPEYKFEPSQLIILSVGRVISLSNEK